VVVCGFGVKKMNGILAENAKNQCKICHAFIAKLQAFMQNPLGRSNLWNASLFGIFFHVLLKTINCFVRLQNQPQSLMG